MITNSTKQDGRFIITQPNLWEKEKWFRLYGYPNYWHNTNDKNQAKIDITFENENVIIDINVNNKLLKYKYNITESPRVFFKDITKDGYKWIAEYYEKLYKTW